MDLKRTIYVFAMTGGLIFTSCNSDDDGVDEQAVTPTCTDGVMNGDETGVDCGGSCTPCTININIPQTYVFERNGESTVSFDGQTTRILMANELLASFNDNTVSAEALNAKFAHQEGATDFEDADLNSSDKNIKSKTAASQDYFSTNAADQALIQEDFEGWIQAQVNEVFPNWQTVAEPGVAGQLADGERTRYVSGRGLEFNQLFAKGLIGALMTDQTLNNYLSPAVLDEGENQANNDAGTPEDGFVYTTMEHKWDEAYGYVYGLNADPADPNADLGADSFLNEYIERLESDPDFAGIADEIFQLFKFGRAAIVAGDYKARDVTAGAIRSRISKVIAVRAVFYLQAGKRTLAEAAPNYGSAFHALSEAYGFIYSLQFTRNPDTEGPYFSKSESEAFLTDLMDDGENGFWDVTPETLDAISRSIADGYDFTVAEAAE